MNRLKRKAYMQWCQFELRKKGRKDNNKSRNPFVIADREFVELELKALFSKAYINITNLDCVAYVTEEPVSFNAATVGTEIKGRVPFKWAKNAFDCAWMRVRGNIPSGVPAEKCVVIADVGGEGLVVSSAGENLQGITTQCSEFSYRLGLPMKKVILIDKIVKDNKIDFWIDAAANDLFGNFANSGKVVELALAVVNSEFRSLYYDISVLLSLCDFSADSKYISDVYSAVRKALSQVRFAGTDTVRKIRQRLHPYLAATNDGEAFEYSAIGHAHLDLAWLWPIRETRRKAARTFSTQLLNIDRYPTYLFGASQAQLYAWVKHDYPDIYEKIKTAVKDGRWELQGATWVEPDSNLISGESLIRQFYYGKQFFREEFGEEMEMFWVPDSFGYSACIPQVMKLAGVKYFLTQKMSWNTVNEFPYNTFNWQGLDGSTVFAHMLPENTYNSPCHPSSMTEGASRYKEKAINQSAMMLFGIGDGGAGPGFEHIERMNRLRDLKGMPKVTPGKAIDFFKKISERAEEFPTHSGELYLERHQGTYTTRSQNKKANRMIEIKLHNYELLAAIANANGLALPIQPKEQDALWHEVLLYQFHDILPGSSINRVYEECLPRYDAMMARLQDGIEKICGKEGALFNPTSFKQTVWRKYNDSWKKYIMPPLGIHKLSTGGSNNEFTVNAASDALENELIKVEFKDGCIAGIIDKSTGKQFIKNACSFTSYRDIGDCWDIRPVDYYKNIKTVASCISFGLGTDGPIALAESKFVLLGSTITQRVSIVEDSKVVRIELIIDAHQKEAMMRFAVPTTIVADKAAFNVQFGHIYRPTTDDNSIEKAQFEVSAQKFVDISEKECGLSLLNDCKYGYRVKNGTIDVDLIRSPKGGPGKDVDQGEQTMVFGLLPHKGGVGIQTYKEAYLINNPPFDCAYDARAFGFYSTDNESIIAETIKNPSDGSADMIVRFYNPTESEQVGDPTFNGFIRKEVVDIDEKFISESEEKITLKPFELVTYRYIKDETKQEADESSGDCAENE